jgi:glycosyltransferase involved in cell wall biosynthesis
LETEPLSRRRDSLIQGDEVDHRRDRRDSTGSLAHLRDRYACPDRSGAFVEKNVSSPELRVIVHEHNQGVGGAVMTGYKAAITDGADAIVKVDGDGQMDPKLIPHFVDPVGRSRLHKGEPLLRSRKDPNDAAISASRKRGAVVDDEALVRLLESI